MTIGASHNDNPDQSGVLSEDQARADVYSLLSSLFYGPPTHELLRNIATQSFICNDVQDSEFCRAWRAMQQAAATDAEAVQQEYDAAFISTGRAAVMLYGSYYLAGFLNEKPLAQLRDALAQMGLARRGDRHESEDHISALCDVMRFLIVGDRDAAPAALESQREFFRQYIASWHVRLCDAVENAADTRFYKHVARFARAFFDLENESFELA